MTLIFGFLLLYASIITPTHAPDTISSNQILRYNETIISPLETFELGFFNPANRNIPLTHTSGELTLTLHGVLLLRDSTSGTIVWSSTNSSSNSSTRNPIGKLQDTGNFIIYEEGNNIDQEDPTWQSFDFPTDTLLPGMKHGKNLVTGIDRHMTSWKSSDDPTSGEFSNWIDTKGYPQQIIRKCGDIMFRGGPWNGVRFTGNPYVEENRFLSFTFVLNDREIYFQFNQMHSPNLLPILMRLALQPSENSRSSSVRRRVRVIVPVSLIVLVILLSICLYYRFYRKKTTTTRSIVDEKLELPLFGLSTILKATNNFSMDNKLGEGGFGPVYKGVLEDEKEIAVKRLAKRSTQGLQEFKNEVILISKLQHRNLVKLLGCCIEGDEKMLVYEYMPNKSLDSFIFDKTRSKLLDWSARYRIINGIARGLLYLHQDSRLRIIHRDLKVSNILLDTDMNPKISDFGMARTFGGNQIEANTNRVVGTYGYMAPEYAGDGIFSMKSDVYSFGVLVLEIVCGEKNRLFVNKEHSNNLIGHVWELYNEGTSLQLVEKGLVESINISQVQRSIHVSLLCVQRHPENRPTMTSVIMMLGSEGPLLAPKEPGFYNGKTKKSIRESSSSYGTNSNN
ncbi:hypothetical protein SSX86_030554 [Deinandra increscens subsp. villosa]|uniref:non-specific serine/threonine protein kinase n=1 Tax=Deinandra increscens subsp. villosa TaxID=3103831 RepID=A0AAP0GJZ7_9ASTR